MLYTRIYHLKHNESYRLGSQANYTGTSSGHAVFVSLLYAFVKFIKPNEPPGSSITMTDQIHGSLAGFQIDLHIYQKRENKMYAI